jgi:hypothetical protein
MNWEGYGRKRGTLLSAIREIGFKLSGDKSKYKLLSRHQNAGQDYAMKTASRSLKNVTQFKYLGTTVTQQNLI